MIICAVTMVSGDESQNHGITDVYKLKMVVKVPRIYDNMTSMGYRKYQTQSIKGRLLITYPSTAKGEVGYPEVRIVDLENQTHKINGKKITYNVTVGGDGPFTRVNLIGSNKKNVFDVASICFYIDAEPSYNVGEDDPDNSLLCTMSGRGTTKKYKVSGCPKDTRYIKTITGNLAGTLGCGCSAYGHISPTRVAGERGASDIVDDVAAIYGTWRATYDKSYSGR